MPSGVLNLQQVQWFAGGSAIWSIWSGHQPGEDVCASNLPSVSSEQASKKIKLKLLKAVCHSKSLRNLCSAAVQWGQYYGNLSMAAVRCGQCNLCSAAVQRSQRYGDLSMAAVRYGQCNLCSAALHCGPRNLCSAAVQSGQCYSNLSTAAVPCGQRNLYPAEATQSVDLESSWCAIYHTGWQSTAGQSIGLESRRLKNRRPKNSRQEESKTSWLPKGDSSKTDIHEDENVLQTLNRQGRAVSRYQEVD